MAIETIRISERQRYQLIVLKRRTGIANWNVLCRWALCLSLAEPTRPSEESIPADSSVEMSWKTFGGTHSNAYLALLRQRARSDGVDLNQFGELYYFRLHLNRGIAFLYQKFGENSLESLLHMASSDLQFIESE